MCILGLFLTHNQVSWSSDRCKLVLIIIQILSSSPPFLIRNEFIQKPRIYTIYIIINFQKIAMIMFHQEYSYNQSIQDQSSSLKRYQQDDQQCSAKIQRRFEQTKMNNKSKQYYDKFVLRNCRMYYFPIKSCIWLSNRPQLKRIKQLNLSEMDLRNLENLPDFPTLKKLDLTMNFITDNQIVHILRFRKLQLLYLTENFIKGLKCLEQLSQLRQLKQIDISSNPVEYQRQTIFKIIYNQKLNIVDRFTKLGTDLQRNGLFNDNDSEDMDDYSNSDSQMQSEREIQRSEAQSGKRQQSNIVFGSVRDDFSQSSKMESEQSEQSQQQQQKQSEDEDEDDQEDQQQDESEPKSKKQMKINKRKRKKQQSEQEGNSDQDQSQMKQEGSQKKAKKKKIIVKKQNSKSLTYQEAQKRLQRILESLK